jgi:hypothetical protein
MSSQFISDQTEEMDGSKELGNVQYLSEDEKKMKKKEIAKKMIRIPKKELLSEHKRIIPELKKAGLKQEAKKQGRELQEYQK